MVHCIFQATPVSCMPAWVYFSTFWPLERAHHVFLFMVVFAQMIALQNDALAMIDEEEEEIYKKRTIAKQKKTIKLSGFGIEE